MTITEKNNSDKMSLDLQNRTQAQAEFLMYGWVLLDNIN
jgi:hypothetical protein